MKLGILVTTDKHLEHVLGIARAALAKRHEVSVFLMDTGTHLVADPALTGLAQLPGVKIGLCDHSAKMHGIAMDGLPTQIACGSQFQNAMMNHNADRVISL